MTFTIHKGRHRAWPLYWLCWWPLLINPVGIGRRVAFTFSAKYTLPNGDQADRNKLFGISFSFNLHRNSARFGWRYDPLVNKFILSAYCYINGRRHMEDICEVVVNRLYDCTIVITRSDYIFQVKQADNGNVFRTISIPKEHSKKNGYLLGLYFGGNQTAPDTINIQMKRI